jgi:hypothetical protein
VAASKLRSRFHMMAIVAGFIVVGETLLLLTLMSIGLLYLPLACFLAGAVAYIPYHEYRSIERSRPLQPHSASPQSVASTLQRLQPELRAVALIPLGLAAATSIFLLLVFSSSWHDRIVPLGMMFATAMFFLQLIKERRILSSYAPTLARIVEFQRTRRSRAAIYEYESPAGVVRGHGGSLQGFEVGMTVPILYNVFKPNESLAVPDFLFYRIRNQAL